MLSIGGYVSKINQMFNPQKYDLDALGFVNYSKTPYLIDAPNLTYKEILLLNSKVPTSEDSIISDTDLSFIPLGERRKFLKFYKYLPNYMDVNY